MENAKQNLKLIDIHSKVSDRKETEIPLKISAGRKIHALNNNNLRSDPPKRSQTEKKIGKAQLINKLNFVNFQDGIVLIGLTHRRYDKAISLKATPQPCNSDLAECLWADDKNISKIIQSYVFRNLIIPNGQTLLKVVPELLRIDEKGISVLLPDNGNEITYRKVRRYPCRDISAQLIQSSSVFIGSLVDFNGYSFNVKLRAVPPQTFEWLNISNALTLVLSGCGSPFGNHVSHNTKKEL